MDRFIVEWIGWEIPHIPDLKSNMDRFIGRTGRLAKNTQYI